MIEINMKIEICDSRTPTLGTLSMISLETDFVNIYYTIFNNTAIIYIDSNIIAILNFTYMYMIHSPSRLTTLTVCVYSLF